MEKLRKSGFMEGAIIATLAIFISKLLGIIYVIPFYQIVGPKGGALYAYAYNIYNFFLIISSAGIPLAISKLVSEYNTLGKEKEKEYLFKTMQKIIFAFSLISFLICFFASPLLAKLFIGNLTEGNSISDVSFVIKCVSFAILVVPLLSISRGYLQGHGYIRPASFSQIIEQGLRIIVIIAGSFLCLNVFHLSLRTGIGVAVFGACIGAIASYTYLIDKLLKIRKKNNNTDDLKKSEKQEIIKKVISYAIPFVIINVANTLYSSTDMILLNRALDYIGFNGNDIETIISIFTTWGGKLNTIITSIATGIAISLIPNLAKSNAKKDYQDINDKFNKIMEIFFYVALPLSIFISIFANQIWNIFFSPNEYGPIVVRYSILIAAVDALYIMICNGLQGLNKSKLIYISVLLGLGINLTLDFPLMILFNKLNIYPYYGAITATLIGYLISLIIPLISLKKEYKLDFTNLFKKLPKLFSVYILMIFLSFIARQLCDIINISNRIFLIFYIGIIGIVLIIIYYLTNKKEIENILGKSIKEMLGKKRDK